MPFRFGSCTRISVKLFMAAPSRQFFLGMPKFVPGLSLAQDLATRTTDVLSFGLAPAGLSIVLLSALKCTIGTGLISGRHMRLVLALSGFQMIGAMSPLFHFPDELFGGPFHAPTLLGQYMIKDVVLISAGLVLGATMHGGRIVFERVRRAENYTRYAARSTESRLSKSPR